MKIQKLLSIIAVLFLSVSSASASQIHLQPYDEVAEKITNVCVLKVDKVETEEKYQHFKNGIKKLSSTTIIIHGTVENHLLGEFEAKNIVTKFTSVVPIKYSEDGEQEMSVSYIRPISGHEHDVKIGEKYIFSYTWFDKEKSEQYHLRMDLLEDESKIIEVLKNKGKI